jgi:hypothetical protein
VLRSTGTQVEWFTIPTIIPTLQQVLTAGNTSDVSIILTANIQAVTATANNVVSNTSLSVLGTLRDKDSSVGTAGQILSSTGTKVQWVDAPIYTATSPLSIDSGTRVISIQQAGSTQDGYLSSADWISFNGKQNGITLTTLGSSGAASFIGSVLNVPNYTLVGLGGVPLSRTLSINGVTYDLSADRSWVVDGLPSQVGNNGKYLTTDGTTASWGVINLSGYVPTSRTINTTGPLVGGGDLSADRTISIPAATGSVNGYLSFGDWNTFNNKQDALGFTPVPTTRTLTINGTTYDLSANRSWTIDALPSQTGNSGKYLTTNGTIASWDTIVGMGIGNAITSATAGSVLFAGTSGILQQDNANFFWDDTNNRLGIGTSSPLATLHLVSSAFALRATLANGDGLFISNDATTTYFQSFTGGFDSRNFNVSAKEIVFRSGIASYLERMRLTNAGRLLIGTVSESTYILDVNGTSRIKATGNGGDDGLVIISQNGTAFMNVGYGGFVVNQAIFSIGRTSGALSISLNGTTSIIAATNDAFDGLMVKPNNSSQTFKIGYQGLQSTYQDIFLTRNTGEISVGINSTTTFASAVLHASSTTKGFLPPRMTTTQKNAISSPAAGLQVYDATLNVSSYYNGTAWVDNGASIYNSDGTLTSNRTVSTATGFKLTLNPNLEVVTTTYNPTAGMLGWSAVNGYVQTTIPASTSFTSIGYAFSSLIGNNYMTYAGSASFAADIFTGAIVGINNFGFTAASSTITISQSSSIRTYSAGLYQNTTSGSINGTLTHLSGLAVRPIFRATGTSTITVTNNYGLLIADQNEYNHATITNRWGIYQEGANDNNYFRGKVLIGTSNTIGSSVLNINGLPTSSAGLSTGDIWNNLGVLMVV